VATYRVTAPDGTKFKVTAPDDATPDQVQAFAEQQFASMATPQQMQAPAQANAAAPQMSRADFLKRELMRSPPVALARGVKDIIDTGAQALASTFGSKEEAERVRAMNQAGRAEFDAATSGQVLPQAGRVVGNIVSTAPAVNALGGAVGAVAPRLGQAITSGGISTGAAPGGAVADLGLRALGGAIGGGLSAGMVNPDEAGTGAMVGAAIPVAGKIVQGAAGIAKQALGATTGVGDAAISQAVRAGREGGKTAQQFTEAMRGQSSMDDVLAAAKSNLDAMRQSKQAAYRAGMADISKDRTMLDFGGIDKALTDAAERVTYRGVSGTASPQVKSQTAALAIAKMSDEVAAWRKLDPKEFHTPEGFDALKQKLGDILEGIPFEDKTARLVAGKIYNAAKDSIQAQAPTYAKVMGDYSKASGTISEIEKALSQNPRASVDTQMRKLQSLMRNNVNTSYGYRDELAKLMIAEGGNDFMPALAGQAMNSWVPRGIQRATGGLGAVALGGMGQLPAAAGFAAASSPRLVGESAYLMGRALSPLEQLLGPAARVAPVIAANRNNERP